MAAFSFECIKTYEEFQAVRDDWEEFIHSFFPQSYGRTHAWLSAYWTTYHHKKPSLMYIQRNQSSGKIVAVAPLFVQKENFGGFPVLSLQVLGSGIGTDDFLISPESSNFVETVLTDLVQNQKWHVANFRRLRSTLFCENVIQACAELACSVNCSEADDFFIDFPATYKEYLNSRTRNFRRNLNRAANRLEHEGTITEKILDPINDARRVWEIGCEVAAKSWQFRQGKSHFNDGGDDTFYTNLARSGKGAGGEEFTALFVGERPAAYLLGCRRGGTFFAVDTAFHDDFRHVSIGRVLLGRIIERLIGEGEISVFDFEGSGEYKDYYATGSRMVKFLTIYNNSFYPRCIRLIRNSRFYSTFKGISNRQRREVATDA